MRRMPQILITAAYNTMIYLYYLTRKSWENARITDRSPIALLATQLIYIGLTTKPTGE